MGATVKRIKLKGTETSISFSYDFFSEPDRVTVMDQSGKVLLNSKMEKTVGIVDREIQLKNVTELVFKIESSVPESRWVFWYETL